MKKLYTLILSITFAFTVNAQLSLTKAINEPLIGDVSTKFGFDSVGVVPKNVGAAQTWSFAAFTQNTVVAVSTWTTVASTPSAASFPNASIAEDAGNGNYNYFKSNTSTFELNGIALSGGIAITFTDNAIAALWPINYTYNNTDVFSGTASTPLGTGPANGTITTTAPGNGTLLLPGGQTFTNALQVKAVNNIKATVGSFPFSATIAVNGTDWTYYSSTQKFPLLTVSYSKQTLTTGAGSTVTATATIRINSAVYAGINELNFDNAYSVYPNPASGAFNIALTNLKTENVSVEILNQMGQSVKKENLGNANNINSTINTSGFNSGVYFVRTTMGNKTSVKKLIIE